MLITSILLVSEILLGIIVGLYFLSQLKDRNGTKNALSKESEKSLFKLRQLRSIKLSEPMSESVRPKTIDDIIGQKDALKALTGALCTSNPQHILIYGPPGVGKTASARVIFDEAKKCENSPFLPSAKFIETDATIMRFDERSIADPLIGSVHDPIYQGAGNYGNAGIPQPKMGAVTKAHGGVLFIDEIGELHPSQMNKLLKVLEDRKVMLESAYYSSENSEIPPHIHDVFKNGLPADFRLIGATTRRPEEMPPALRSRCIEIFFKPLNKKEIYQIAKNASVKCEVLCSDEVIEKISLFSKSGRDAVKILQSCASSAMIEKRKKVTLEDVDWVVSCGQYSQRMQNQITESRIGHAFALGVSQNEGFVLEIESEIKKSEKGMGKIFVSGIAEDEEIKTSSGNIKRKSSAMCSFENALSLLEKVCKIKSCDYDIKLNFIGGVPVDGPSAGVSMFCALYSAMKKVPLPPDVAFTGEICFSGDIRGVGGVFQKVDSAIDFGLKKVFIPRENYNHTYSGGIEIIPVNSVKNLLPLIFPHEISKKIPKNTVSIEKSIVS